MQGSIMDVYIGWVAGVEKACKGQCTKWYWAQVKLKNQPGRAVLAP